MKEIRIDNEKIEIISNKHKPFSNKVVTTKTIMFFKDINQIVKDITYDDYNFLSIYTKDGREGSIDPSEVEDLESIFTHLKKLRKENNIEICTFDLEGAGLRIIN